MSLLPEGTVILLELSVRLPDLCFLYGGKQMGDDKRPDMDLP